jgi:hypothetical protein
MFVMLCMCYCQEIDTFLGDFGVGKNIISTRCFWLQPTNPEINKRENPINLNPQRNSFFLSLAAVEGV